MEASEIKAKIDKIKNMPGLSDKARADMIAAWEKKLLKDEKPQPKRVKKSTDDVKPKKVKPKYKKGEKVHVVSFDQWGIIDEVKFNPEVVQNEYLVIFDDTTKERILEPDISRKKALSSKVKTKTTHKYKGKTVPELDDKDCEDLIKETAERRKKAAKAEKKSKSRPIIEKVTVPIIKAVKKAIENIAAADLKDDPKKELSMVDKAIAATKRFMIELKGIFGEDWDKETVDGEMKDLHALGKELHKKYGE